MIKKVFKPFWSYDVVKTENWLNLMSEKGYRLVKVNFLTRTFIFEQCQPKKEYYRIVFQKKLGGNVPQDILEAGYSTVVADKNYYIVKTSNTTLEKNPTYFGILDRNRTIKYTVGNFLIFFMSLVAAQLFIVLIFFSVLIFGSTIIEETPPIENVPLPSTIEMIGIISFFAFSLLLWALIIWMIYTFFKLRSTNKQLEILSGVNINLSFTIPTEGLLSKKVEKELFKSKKMFKKTKFAWFYAPDLVENWLEKMETQGYNLYRMSKIGSSFYFIKGQPRKIKYIVEYKSKASPQYFAQNQMAGWKLIFTSFSKRMAYVVWSKEYANDIEPEFYCDLDAKLKHAKNYALKLSLMYFPICLLYLLLVAFNLSMPNLGNMPLFTVIIFLLLIFEFGFFAIRTILYYFRTKKRLQQKDDKNELK